MSRQFGNAGPDGIQELLSLDGRLKFIIANFWVKQFRMRYGKCEVIPFVFQLNGVSYHLLTPGLLKMVRDSPAHNRRQPGFDSRSIFEFFEAAKTGDQRFLNQILGSVRVVNPGLGELK